MKLVDFLYSFVHKDEVGVYGRLDWNIISSFVFDALKLTIQASNHFSNFKRSICWSRKVWIESSCLWITIYAVLSSLKWCKELASYLPFHLCNKLKAQVLPWSTPSLPLWNIRGKWPRQEQLAVKDLKKSSQTPLSDILWQHTYQVFSVNSVSYSFKDFNNVEWQ